MPVTNWRNNAFSSLLNPLRTSQNHWIMLSLGLKREKRAEKRREKREEVREEEKGEEVRREQRREEDREKG